jgi:methylated-DNA-[protein]-cysteine S-methyltransferase
MSALAAASLPMRIFIDRIATPLGEMLLAADEQGVLRAADFHDYESRMHKLLRIHYGAVATTSRTAMPTLEQCVGAYFDGDLSALTRIEWTTGGTQFQRRVWQMLTVIPVGTTQTYGEMARELGGAQAARAVGLANGANPLSIIVPCHRLVGANGSLTGYAGGLHRKEWLLRHEGAMTPRNNYSH